MDTGEGWPCTSQGSAGSFVSGELRSLKTEEAPGTERLVGSLKG